MRLIFLFLHLSFSCTVIKTGFRKVVVSQCSVTLKYSELRLTPLCACLPDEESPGLYGFLHVIVHSAQGFKESASESATSKTGLLLFFPNHTSTHGPAPVHPSVSLIRSMAVRAALIFNTMEEKL